MISQDTLNRIRRIGNHTPDNHLVMRQYSMIEFTNMAQLRSLFPTTVCGAETFVLFGDPSSTVTCGSISEAEAILRQPGLIVPPRIRVLVVNTLITAMAFGSIEVEPEDIKFLRRLEASSYEVVGRHALNLRPQTR